jgi:hypothetical protein
LYIWDSTGSGFKAYNLTNYAYVSDGLNLTGTWTIGGGYEGSNMVLQAYGGPHGYDASTTLDRYFDADGNQIAFYRGAYGGGVGMVEPLAVGAYIIENNQYEVTTGIYAIDQAQGLLMTGGVTYMAPDFESTNEWNFPAGWYLVGAPANGTVSPPWN